MHIMRIFMDSIKNKSLLAYIDSMIACFAAPTLEGMKAGTLVRIKRQGEDVLSVWQRNRDCLLEKYDVDAFLLFPNLEEKDPPHDRILLLLYKSDLLKKILFQEKSLTLLSPLGYNCSSRCLSSYFSHLQKRMEKNFPHEIGLFLNYPPEDVEAFMKDEGRNALFTGYWQVYGNVRAAKKKFRRYRRAEYSAARRLVQQELPRAQAY